MSIFDNIKITIKLRGFDENPVAIATLNLNGEAEVRFIPILWTRNRNNIFLTMPSLKGYRYQNCFVINDTSRFSEIRKQILQEFLAKAEKEYHRNEFDRIQKAITQQKEDINPDEIPL